VKDEDGNHDWKFTGFYGHPESGRQTKSWALLKHLKNHQPVPWLCGGDFNEILEQSEKEGVAVSWLCVAIRWESQMHSFCEALEECRLCDLGYTDPRFTWSNRCNDKTFTKERLNRAVANIEWCCHFQEVTLVNLVT